MATVPIAIDVYNKMFHLDFNSDELNCPVVTLIISFVRLVLSLANTNNPSFDDFGSPLQYTNTSIRKNNFEMTLNIFCAIY